MTVKESLKIIGDPNAVDLSWDGSLVNFNFRNEIEVDVWGDYIVKHIRATKECCYELQLDACPVKKGAAV